MCSPLFVSVVVCCLLCGFGCAFYSGIGGFEPLLGIMVVSARDLGENNGYRRADCEPEDKADEETGVATFLLAHFGLSSFLGLRLMRL